MNVSFEDFIAPERFDGLPWVRVLIDESLAEGGPWNRIDSIPLVPLDTDPAHPRTREFSTNLATLAAGWYKVSWQDLSGQINEAQPIHNVQHSRPEFWPAISDVGALLRARTTDTNGNELGTFTDATRPTAQQAEDMIGNAARDVAIKIGNDIPDNLVPAAQSLVTLKAAMYIELSYFPEQVATGRSPYEQYKALYDETLPSLIEAVQNEEAAAGDEDSTLTGGFAKFNFPVNRGGLIGWSSRW